MNASARGSAPLLHVPPGALLDGHMVRGITTRIGFPPAVISDDPDSPDRTETRHILAQRLRVDIDRFSWVRQVHGATLLEAHRSGLLGEADALATENSDRILLISVADCVPVLLWQPKTRLRAAAHAGWRGVVAGVIESTLDWFDRRHADPATLRVWLGPHIGPAHFEVGSEVAAQFAPEHVIAPSNAGANPHVDLAAAIRDRLTVRGIDPRRVTQSPYCTYSDRDLFWSYRRDGGICGRHVAFLGG